MKITKLQLRAGRVLSTLALVKEVAEPEVLPAMGAVIGNLWVLVANAGVQNSVAMKFIASTGFGVTAFRMFFFAVFSFAPPSRSVLLPAPIPSLIITANSRVSGKVNAV